ncbi:hypothetical protein F4604DRAFT_2040001 [Suillus subluteus]|nr:hypothetical protein F4604DRAFT_2040001 [Suillus subluteus]
MCDDIPRSDVQWSLFVILGPHSSRTFKVTMNIQISGKKYLERHNWCNHAHILPDVWLGVHLLPPTLRQISKGLPRYKARAMHDIAMGTKFYQTPSEEMALLHPSTMALMSVPEHQGMHKSLARFSCTMKVCGFQTTSRCRERMTNESNWWSGRLLSLRLYILYGFFPLSLPDVPDFHVHQVTGCRPNTASPMVNTTTWIPNNLDRLASNWAQSVQASLGRFGDDTNGRALSKNRCTRTVTCALVLAAQLRSRPLGFYPEARLRAAAGPYHNIWASHLLVDGVSITHQCVNAGVTRSSWLQLDTGITLLPRIGPGGGGLDLVNCGRTYISGAHGGLISICTGGLELPSRARCAPGEHAV